jgi:hypothetical protein
MLGGRCNPCGLIGADDTACDVFQKLNVGGNALISLPQDLDKLGKLRELNANNNQLLTVPVSVLKGMPALTTIHLRWNSSLSWGAVDRPLMFHIRAPLAPILHPGLVHLDLRQYRDGGCDFQEVNWDPVSLFHLGQAMIEVADRKPLPTLLFKI